MRGGVKRIVGRVWATAGIAFTIWMYVGFQAVGVPDDAAETDEYVSVVAQADGMDFRPLVNPQGSGVIFLPGGIVDPVAYTPLMKSIAHAGYRAHLLYLPMRCACTDSQIEQLFQNVQTVIAAEPDTAWILAGHSRGGMLASRFVHQSDDELAGLALIGTTHPRDFSLAGTKMPVTKIYGTRDGIATHAAMLKNRHLLPSDTTWVEIPGGNHVQFAYYRHQLGDDEATISLVQQQKAVEKAILNVLKTATDSL